MVALQSVQQLNVLVDDILEYLEKDIIKAYFSTYNQGDYFEERIAKFIELFWFELSEANYDWSLSVNNFVDINSVPIMTIHKSKGLEYKAVYFIGLEDSAF